VAGGIPNYVRERPEKTRGQEQEFVVGRILKEREMGKVHPGIMVVIGEGNH